MTQPIKVPDWEQQLRELLPNWDGEGADLPSEEAINKTKEIVAWANLHNLDIESIDPDVLGGTGIYLRGVNNRTAWIAILNHQNPTIVITQDRRTTGCRVDKQSLEGLKLFLTVD
jgi:hypothetical protein